MTEKDLTRNRAFEAVKTAGSAAGGGRAAHVRRVLRHCAPFLWYACLALVVTWPLALHPASRLGALSGPGDAYLNLWVIGWDLQTITESPRDLVTGRIFDANIFHPARQTLTFTDVGIVPSLLAWPAYALSGDIVVAYNALLVLSLFLSASAMWLLAWRVTGSRWGATAAGTVWGFWSYPLAHVAPGHLQLQCLYLLPLAWWFLHRLIAGGLWRDAIGFGAAVGLLAAASVYYGVIGTVGLGASALALSLAVGARGARRLLRRGIVSIAVGALFVLPVAIPYWQASRREGFGRNLFDASQHAASVASYVNAPPFNLLYGRTGWLVGDPDAERQLFTGFVTLALAALGLAVARRRGSWPLAASSLALIALGAVLSLGPDGVRPVYAFLQQWVVGFEAIRAPARFAVLVMLGLSLAVALGVREVAWRAAGRWPGRSRRAGSVLALVAGLLTAEHLNLPLRWVEAPPLTSPLGRWLKEAPGDGAVIHLPLEHDLVNTPYMVDSLEHRRPIVNGYSGQRPAFYSAVVEAMSGFPSAEAFWTLRDLGVQYVVTAPGVDIAAWPLVERARLPDASGGEPRVIYEMAWDESVEATLAEPASVAPPAPGAAPFAVGERATYEAIWDGPAGRIRAGTITTAVAPAGDGGWRFDLRAETAPWMTQFFTARDELSSEVDRNLLPRRHEQRLREGARRVDRTFTFDPVNGRVESSAGGPALRLWLAARDPLTAYFYLRTLPLASGSRMALPVNDNGRNLTLDLQVDGVETILVGGQPVEALRLTPVLRPRVERRRPLEITAWLSLDARRVLLAATVVAPFGDVRVELVSHTTTGGQASGAQ